MERFWLPIARMMPLQKKMRLVKEKGKMVKTRSELALRLENSVNLW